MSDYDAIQWLAIGILSLMMAIVMRRIEKLSEGDSDEW